MRCAISADWPADRDSVKYQTPIGPKRISSSLTFSCGSASGCLTMGRHFASASELHPRSYNPKETTVDAKPRRVGGYLQRRGAFAAPRGARVRRARGALRALFRVRDGYLASHPRHARGSGGSRAGRVLAALEVHAVLRPGARPLLDLAVLRRAQSLHRPPALERAHAAACGGGRARTARVQRRPGRRGGAPGTPEGSASAARAAAEGPAPGNPARLLSRPLARRDRVRHGRGAGHRQESYSTRALETEARPRAGRGDGRMIDHEELLELAEVYALGGLAPAERARLAEHVDDC